MNWGYKISFVFAGFVSLIIVLVVISMRQKDIHLVTEKYYEKEIAYQDQIDIEENTAALASKPVLAYESQNQVLKIKYPDHFHKDKISGSVLFYRPSDANMDFVVAVKPETNNMQEILVGHLNKGLWKIKMEWTSGVENYYLEEKLIIR